MSPEWLENRNSSNSYIKHTNSLVWRSKTTFAELVYGESLQLLGDILTSRNDVTEFDDATQFIKGLRYQIQQIRPVNGTCPSEKRHFVFRKLVKCIYE